MAKPIQVLAITGGKGGVGKTNISVNTAISLARQGRRVAVLDADFGLANVDVLLGLQAKRSIEQVLDGECTLEEIVLNGPAGIKIIPASSGARRLTQLSTLEQAGLIRAFTALASQLDVLIVDTAAGISDSVLHFVSASREIVVIICNEPASLTDAYAMIKVLNRDFGRQRFRVLSSMVADEDEGRSAFAKLQQVCQQFLEVGLFYAGHIPFDKSLQEAVKKQKPVVEYSPSCAASRAFARFADEIEAWPASRRQGGELAFFVEQLFAPSFPVSHDLDLVR